MVPSRMPSTRTADICDAHVALVASGESDVLYTSDPDDLQRLLRACGRAPALHRLLLTGAAARARARSAARALANLCLASEAVSPPTPDTRSGESFTVLRQRRRRRDPW
jgi:hypothetical protein